MEPKRSDVVDVLPVIESAHGREGCGGVEQGGDYIINVCTDRKQGFYIIRCVFVGN